jgi:hypothetical protein
LLRGSVHHSAPAGLCCFCSTECAAFKREDYRPANQASVGRSKRNGGGHQIRNNLGKGRYFFLQIPTVPTEVTLVFTHVAYQPVEVKLNPGKTYVKVQLKPKPLLPEEVKVATVKKLKPEKVSSGSVLDYELLGDKVDVPGWQAGTKMPALSVLQRRSDSNALNLRK